MQDKEKDIELRSEDVQDVMGQVPPAILRWGITVIALVVLLLLVGCFIFKYPDTLTGKATLTTQVPPANILARASGKIDKLYVVNNQQVKAGTMLAVIQNPANTTDVQLLITRLQGWDSENPNATVARKLLDNKPLALGSIQTSYTFFQETLTTYLRKDYMDNESIYLLQLRTATEQLRTELNSWERNFLLVSPIDGTVNLMGYWSNNQNVGLGEIVFSVVPTVQTMPVCKMLLPAQGSGKVVVGQRANVRLNNFPDQEFGYLEGRVEHISDTPDSDGMYVVEIRFPKGLVTNYGVQLPITSQMQGSAEIITEDIRLIVRFFNPIKKLLLKYT